MNKLTDEQKNELIINTINDWDSEIIDKNVTARNAVSNAIKNGGIITDLKLSLRTGLSIEHFDSFQQLIKDKNHQILNKLIHN